MNIINRHNSLVAIAAAFLLGSASSIVLAANLSGGTANVNPGDAAENWILTDGATLNVHSGGQSGGIAADASTVNIEGGTVNYNSHIAGINAGVDLLNGSIATISGTTISTNESLGAVFVGHSVDGTLSGDMSVANIVNSTLINSYSVGINVSGGTIKLSGSTVQGGTGAPLAFLKTGAIVSNGTLNVADGSSINGNYGLVVVADFRAGNDDIGRSVVVDHSTIEGQSGSAILVKSNYSRSFTTADILVANGSSLHSSNGIALKVEGGYSLGNELNSSVNFTVDNSTVEGDVVVDNLSTTDVTLQNNAILKGQLSGVGNLTLDSGGTWKMVANGGVANLAMNGGAVEISDGTGKEFHTLTVGTLSGTGTFLAGTHLGLPEGDKLVVTEAGGAKGEFLLRIKNTGAEPTAENALTIVETNGGGATFAVEGGAVDLGTYKYQLERVGDDWRLTGKGTGPGPNPDTPAELSESAKTVISLDAAAANIWYAETGTLRQRLGDVRMGKGENGLWGRSYGRDLKGNGARDTDFDQSIWGLQAGAEREVNLGGLSIILGVFGGYSNSTVDLDGGSKGEVDSGYGGLYATWLGNDGLYVDGLFKINRFSNDARVVMSDSTGAQGDYSATGVGGQVEIGKTYQLASGWYAEPFAQLSALRIGSFNYDLDNGMIAQGDDYESVQGRIGATFGRNLKLDNGGIFQPYVRVAVAQEFIDSNKLRVNMVDFNNAFNGTRGEVGVGFAYQLRDALNLHADMDFSGGKGVSQNWGGNIGVSYKF